MKTDILKKYIVVLLLLSMAALCSCGKKEAEISQNCTISISCSTVLDHKDRISSEKLSVVPENGWILEKTEVPFKEGDTVFDVLKSVCTDNKIHMEFTNTPGLNTAYIEGIGNLYEFDCGEQSGWMYSVNGEFPNYGCSGCKVQKGDEICWLYTCELGKDVSAKEESVLSEEKHTEKQP